MTTGCNFKYYNGISYKCNLKHTSLNSDDDFDTCDFENCIVMRIAHALKLNEVE